MLKQVQHDFDFYYVMGRHEASSSLCIAAMLVEEDPSCLRMTVFLIMSWLQSGDIVEMEVIGLGLLNNTILKNKPNGAIPAQRK